MKNIYTRFLAIVVIIVMTFGCTMIAHADDGNPYQEYYYDIPSTGVVTTRYVPVMSTPSDNGDTIVTLEGSTVCRILGEYDKKWFIIDLTIYDEFEAEYGFVRSKGKQMVKNPSWIMMSNSKSRRMQDRMWAVSDNAYNGGLMVILEENENKYLVLSKGSLATSVPMPKDSVSPFSPEGQELYFVPFDTPLYDDLHEQVGEIPGFTIIEISGEMIDNYLPITANPGTDNEYSGWIVFQTLQRIIN